MSRSTRFALTDLLDNRNRALYNHVSALRPVELEPSSGDGWAEETEAARVAIYVGSSAYPSACFAHELLHAKLELAGWRRPIVNSVEPGEHELVAFLWNQLSHEKIFDEFRALGYPPEHFLNDNDVKQAFDIYKRDMPLLKRLHKKAGGRPIRGPIAIPYIVSRSPHERHLARPPVVAKMLRLADQSYLAQIDALFADWKADTSHDAAGVFARLYKLCGFSDVAFRNAP